MYKKFAPLALVAAILVIPGVASAHVVVKPAQVGVGAFQTFTTGVPNEKSVPVTALKLTIPAGLHEVTPNVKPGWEVSTVKKGADVTEIGWTGGSIPAGQRDDFAFSAQAPARPTELHWKAYQTYADGTVVAWDHAPTGGDDDSVPPYSVTKVVNDLADSNTAAVNNGNNTLGTLGLIFGAAALIISVSSALRQKRR